MQQRPLTIFVVIVTITYAAQIIHFDAKMYTPSFLGPLSVFADQVYLWVETKDCPPSSCKCEVKTNVTSNNVYRVIFSNAVPSSGKIEIRNLQQNTLYSFTLSCVGINETITRHIRTDYGFPLVPQNITVKLNSKHLTLFWSLPLIIIGPITNYKLTIDQQPIIDNISNSQFSYTMIEDYIYGHKHVFFLQTCSINRQNIRKCSDPNDGIATFYMPMTTTLAQETNTQKSTSCILSYSKLFLIFIFLFPSI
ncbi:unnamed protein product [Rotaria sp. Silwood2]|nr:unnamed protein product [Rotaria sp. Silwood2]CAF3893126.1 unnamed protein product [Rotaria sp. Silwood2]